jgi:hypothetical protein
VPIKIRRPQIRIGKKGVKLSIVGLSLGGKGARVNVSRKGASATVGVRGARYNTRRGCLLSPFTWLALLWRKR